MPATKVDAELIESHTGEVIGCSSIIINDFRRKRMANYDFDWHSALQVRKHTHTLTTHTVQFKRSSSIHVDCNLLTVSNWMSFYVVYQIKGDSGRVMHLDHSRMCSLRDLTGIVEAETCRPELLLEPEAINLIYCIARYPQIMLQAKDTHEPCALVKYCYELWWAIADKLFTQSIEHLSWTEAWSICIYHCSKEMRRALKVLYVKNEPNQEIQRQRMLLFMQARRTLHASMTILGLQPLEKM